MVDYSQTVKQRQRGRLEGHSNLVDLQFGVCVLYKNAHFCMYGIKKQYVTRTKFCIPQCNITFQMNYK